MTFSDLRIVLCAIYLAERARSSRLANRWSAVVSCLRRARASDDFASIDAPAVLRLNGLNEEAARLESPSRWAAAVRLCARGEALTATDSAYPARWLSILGPGAPPALHRRAFGLDTDGFACPAVAVVGCRAIGPVTRRAAYDLGVKVAQLGGVLVSGAAAGCDTAAARGAWEAGGRVVEVLPHGFGSLSDAARARRFASWRGLADGAERCGSYTALSVCADGEEFSRSAAMERNTLIYAAADCAVVVEARFGEGGS